MNSVKEIWNNLGTAWTVLPEQDKLKMESVWSMSTDQTSRLYGKLLQRENNYYLLTAPPFFVALKRYFKLFSTNQNSLNQLGLSSLNYQLLPESLIYTDKVTIEYDRDGATVEEDIVYNDLILTKQENSSSQPKVNSIYYMSSLGAVELTIDNRLWSLVNEEV